MNMWKRFCITVMIILALTWMTGCGSDSDSQSDVGKDALSQCVVARHAKNSAEKNREKEKEAEEPSESGFTDLTSFSAETIDGAAFSEKDLSEHDLTVINIWSTTCPPCIEEMPALAELEQSLPDNVSLITWCLDGAFETETAQEILNESGFQGVTLASGDGDMQKLYQQLMYTPTTVAVDSSGKMIGGALIGSPQDPQTGYKDYINQALKALGKSPI